MKRYLQEKWNNMHFENKFSIGDIIAIVVAIFALVGLVMQSKSNSLAEDQLRIQIEDITEVVNQLEIQQNKLIDEEIERLSQGEELYRSQSSMHQQLLDIGRLDRKVTNKYISSLILSTSTSQHALSNIKFDEQTTNMLADGKNINMQLMKVIEFSAAWQAEIQNISELFDHKISEVNSVEAASSETIKQLTDLNKDMALKIAETNGKYSERYRDLNSAFIASQTRLLDRVPKSDSNSAK